MLRKILAMSLATTVSVLGGQVSASEQTTSNAQEEALIMQKEPVVAQSEPVLTQEEAVTFPLAVFDEQQTKAIEDIVHDYLVAHPEILVEMSQKLQQKQLEAQEQASKQVIDAILANSELPVEGNPDAKHYLIEFFDYNCGYCKSAREMMYRLAEEVELKTYYIEMPVLSPMSVRASAIGLALFNQDRDLYLQYQKYLMSKKERLTEEDQIKEAVEHVGANYEQLAEQVNTDPKIQDALRQNMIYADDLGMQGVPLFILDGHILRGAVKDYESLKGFLTQE